MQPKNIDYLEFLRLHLRRHPQWQQGHLKLGMHSLAQGDVATAYASALAVIERADRASAIFLRATNLLAECYIQKGLFERAKAILSEIHSASSQDLGYLENCAAIEIGLENYDQAEKIFEKIGIENMSATANEAFLYLRRRRTGNLYH